MAPNTTQICTSSTRTHQKTPHPAGPGWHADDQDLDPAAWPRWLLWFNTVFHIHSGPESTLQFMFGSCKRKRSVLAQRQDVVGLPLCTVDSLLGAIHGSFELPRIIVIVTLCNFTTPPGSSTNIEKHDLFPRELLYYSQQKTTFTQFTTVSSHSVHALRPISTLPGTAQFASAAPEMLRGCNHREAQDPEATNAFRQAVPPGAESEWGGRNSGDGNEGKNMASMSGSVQASSRNS